MATADPETIEEYYAKKAELENRAKQAVKEYTEALLNYVTFQIDHLLHIQLEKKRVVDNIAREIHSLGTWKDVLRRQGKVERRKSVDSVDEWF